MQGSLPAAPTGFVFGKFENRKQFVFKTKNVFEILDAVPGIEEVRNSGRIAEKSVGK